MRIGIFGGDVAGSGTVEEVISAAREVADQGFASYWLPHIFGADAITLAGAIGREVPDLELGTAVVPTYPRHPMVMAQQALTANALCGGRFTLGIGLSHQIVIEQVLGMSYERPVRHMREHLSILRPLVHEGAVSFQGETLSAQAVTQVPGATPCPILVAALGPRMLDLAGELADGTITWMTGPATLAEHTVPSLAAAAERHDRPGLRVASGIPVCVTDDPDGARERAAQVFAVYGTLPSYRAMLDREGAAGPADIAVVGDEDQVRSGLERFAEVGVTDLLAVEFGAGEERDRTRSVLRSLL